MKAINQLNKWSNAHSEFYILETFRWVLGAFLFYKGVDFFIHSDYLAEVLGPENHGLFGLISIHYVAFAHLVGGTFIVLGLLTRLACLLQIPVLVGAVIINLMYGTSGVEMTMASLALTGVIAYFILGSGRYSLDYNLKLRL